MGFTQFVRQFLDIVGFIVLALMPAIGGGTLRDLILSEPVFWLSDTTYLFITLAAALVTFVSIQFMARLNNVLLWFDAVGLSVFCVIGTAKAMTVLGDPIISVVMRHHRCCRRHPARCDRKRAAPRAPQRGLCAGGI